MAKSQDIVITYGVESLGAESPKQRHERAVAIINKAIAEKKLIVGRDPGYEPTEATALCEKPEPAPLNLSAAHRLSLPTTVYANTYDFLDGTGRLEFVCRACGMRWGYDVTSDTDTAALIQSAAEAVVYSHPETQSFGDRHWCSQCPQEERMYDGYTARECLLMYETRQRADSWAYQVVKAYDGSDCVMWKTHKTLEPLTSAQLTAARTAWSAELKKRQAAAREKERCQVVVDLESVDE